MSQKKLEMKLCKNAIRKLEIKLNNSEITDNLTSKTIGDGLSRVSKSSLQTLKSIKSHFKDKKDIINSNDKHD